MPDLDYSTETTKIHQGYKIIAGVDEVGRGPWAGPVVAAAVILNGADLPIDAKDSKKLTAKKREILAEIIHRKALVSIAEASVEEIDRLNIRQATFLAMERAVAGLPKSVDWIFIDGNAIPEGLKLNSEAVIKGDSKLLSVAAASIVAKVYRDKLMVDLSAKFPHYAWERNAGYGTKAHQEGLVSNGVTPHHRRSFKPVRALL